MTTSETGTSVYGIVYPGLNPGKARAYQKENLLVLENDVLLAAWKIDGDVIRIAQFTDKSEKRDLSIGEAECFEIAVSMAPLDVKKVLKASEMVLSSEVVINKLEQKPDSPRWSDHFSGYEIRAELSAADVGIHVIWRAELRDESNYVREWIQISSDENEELTGITLIDVDAEDAEVAGTVDGSPILSGTFFLGYEHPMSRSAVIDDERASGINAFVWFTHTQFPSIQEVL